MSDFHCDADQRLVNHLKQPRAYVTSRTAFNFFKSQKRSILPLAQTYAALLLQRSGTSSPRTPSTFFGGISAIADIHHIVEQKVFFLLDLLPQVLKNIAGV